MGGTGKAPAATLRVARLLERRAAARIAWAARQARRRYVVTLAVRGSRDPTTGRWPRFAWPVLHATEADAWRAIATLPVFRRNAALPGRIASASVHGILLPLEAAAAELAGRAAVAALDAGARDAEVAAAARAARASVGLPMAATDLADPERLGRLLREAASREVPTPAGPALRRIGGSLRRPLAT